MKTKNILFRADSSSTIGTGHIMRDLVLASQYKDANIIFAVQDLDGNINYKIKEAEHKIKILKSNNIKEVNRLIGKYNIDMIVIDHYGLDHNFEKQLKVDNPTLKIMSLDDTYEEHFCDILLNHNIYADSSRYKNLVPEHCELRCGVDFTLLREEFRLEKTKQKRSTQETKNIFIAMGGADHSDLNIQILKVLESFSSIQVNVVTTTANQYLDELQAYVADKDNVMLYINTDKIARLMNEADLAIVTPSVTVNEIVFMGIPFIAIKTANNQEEMYKYLDKNNYVILEKFNETDFNNSIEKFLNDLKADLVNFIDLPLDEKKMVLRWRNHESVRKWMFTQNEIALNDHLNFINSLSSRKDKIYFLVKVENEAIGVIDFTDINSIKANIGLFAKPGTRGRGGKLMKSIIDYGFNVLGVNSLLSEVYEENEKAIRLYKKFNFKAIDKRENIIVMELKSENRQL